MEEGKEWNHWDFSFSLNYLVFFRSVQQEGKNLGLMLEMSNARPLILKLSPINFALNLEQLHN